MSEQKVSVAALIDAHRTEHETTIADLHRRLVEARVLNGALEAENTRLRAQLADKDTDDA